MQIICIKNRAGGLVILTESMLRMAASEVKNKSQYLSENARFASLLKYDLFISHSFSDKELIVGLYHLFEESGYKVYIDWIDDTSLDRSNVNAETAITIRKRIASSKGLAYISTQNITFSRWCPWELGVSDGMHNRACILPVMNSRFSGQEYLGIYPYLELAQVRSSSQYDFLICDPQDTSIYVVLRDWLNGEQPYKH